MIDLGKFFPLRSKNTTILENYFHYKCSFGKFFPLRVVLREKGRNYFLTKTRLVKGNLNTI
ncbi:MAG: hypothetical protein EBQ94_03245 [Flavobacteriales bacterium]|nr:hypothetical protein [Flavobacteriales bacterium]